MRGRSAVLNRDRDAILRKTVDEIGGAVERVDDPAVLGIRHRKIPGLLAQHRVVGVGLAQDLDDRCFRGAVDLGDEVVLALGADLQRTSVQRRAIDDAAGAARRLDRRVEQGMHGARILLW
jgi:hypothetical protein